MYFQRLKTKKLSLKFVQHKQNNTIHILSQRKTRTKICLHKNKILTDGVTLFRYEMFRINFKLNMLYLNVGLYLSILFSR